MCTAPVLSPRSSKLRDRHRAASRTRRETAAHLEALVPTRPTIDRCHAGEETSACSEAQDVTFLAELVVFPRPPRRHGVGLASDPPPHSTRVAAEGNPTTRVDSRALIRSPRPARGQGASRPRGRLRGRLAHFRMLWLSTRVVGRRSRARGAALRPGSIADRAGGAREGRGKSRARMPRASSLELGIAPITDSSQHPRFGHLCEFM